MALREYAIKIGGELRLRGGLGIDHRRNAIRQQSLEPSKPLPVLKNRRAFDEVSHEGFVVALKKYALTAHLVASQALKHFLRCGSAIDIIAEKDLDRFTSRV